MRSSAPCHKHSLSNSGVGSVNPQGKYLSIPSLPLYGLPSYAELYCKCLQMQRSTLWFRTCFCYFWKRTSLETVVCCVWARLILPFRQPLLRGRVVFIWRRWKGFGLFSGGNIVMVKNDIFILVILQFPAPCHFNCHEVPLSTYTLVQPSLPIEYFFLSSLKQKGKYKLAGQPRLKWAKWAEKGEKKRWLVELNDSWHF